MNDSNVLNLNLDYMLDMNDRVHDDIDPDANLLSNSDFESSYYSDVEFHQLSATISPSAFSMLHMNVRSMQAHYNEFTSYLASLKHGFHVIGITETWLEDSNIDLYGVEGYNHVGICREGRSGGGILLYLQDGISYKVRSRECKPYCESIFIDIDNPHQKITLGVIYRPPNTDLQAFNDYINSLLCKLKTEKRSLYIMGDFNINLLNTNTHARTNDFINSMYSNSLFPVITKPTRISDHSATLIDHIYTNCVSQQYGKSGILFSDISDHLPIFYIAHDISFTKVNEAVGHHRVINETTISNFRADLSNINWENIYSTNDPQTSYTNFEKVLKIAYEKHFPLKQNAKKRANHKPWISSAIIKSIETKNKLYAQYLKDKIDSKKILYTRYKNKLCQIIKKSQKLYYHNKIIEHKNDSKRKWIIIKQIINKHHVSKLGSDKFLIENEMITDKKAIVEAFNNFFLNIGNNVSRLINDSSLDPLYCMKNRIRNSLYFTPTNPEEVRSLVKSLKDKSSGSDNMQPKVLKACHNIIALPLSTIINQCILSGVFPNELKVARIIPIYKGKGDSQELVNYRPISLLNCISKIFEKIIFKRLVSFADKYKILDDNQYGFRSKRSTNTAIISTVNRITQALENNEYVAGIFLDFSKAFDTINHQILLKKLEHYGIRGLSLELIRNYLSNRLQYVSYNGSDSCFGRITCGIPQGSILGPLFFLFYINDIFNVSEILRLTLFADDTSALVTSSKLDSLETNANAALNDLYIWLNANKLCLNVEKSNYMLFKRGNKDLKQGVKLRINNIDLKCVQETKFLGIVINSSLTWKSHVNYCKSKVSKCVGILKLARFLLDSGTLLQLYYTFIYPYLSYCNEIWGNAGTTLLQPLYLLQKRAIRIVDKTNYLAHTQPIFVKYKIVPLFQLHYYLTGIMMYKFYHGIVNSCLENLFMSRESIHGLYTRNRNDMVLPLCKSKQAQSTLRYAGVKIWNDICMYISPKEVILSCFKRQMKDLTFKKYLETLNNV